MAREHASIRLDIWTDQSWRDLTRDEQWLYMLLLSHPSLNYAGVADWRPGRLAALGAQTSRDDIEKLGALLQSKRFILMDDETEEVLIRSFLKYDSILKQPKLSVSMVNAYGSVASGPIRKVIVNELRKLTHTKDDWKGLEHPRVVALMDQPAAPIEEFTQGFTPPVTPSFTPGVSPKPTQGQGLRTSTSTTTSTLSKESVPPPAPKGTRKKPETEFPDGWKPSPAHQAKATEKNIDIDHQAETFESFHKSKGNTYRDWDQAFHTWLNRAKPSPPSQDPPTSYIWD